MVGSPVACGALTGRHGGTAEARPSSHQSHTANTGTLCIVEVAGALAIALLTKTLDHRAELGSWVDPQSRAKKREVERGCSCTVHVGLFALHQSNGLVVAYELVRVHDDFKALCQK